MSDTTGYRRPALGAQPDYHFPAYASSVKRSPRNPLVLLPHTLSELTGPMFGFERMRANDADLTRQHANEPLGERIIVSGRVQDENGRALPNTLVEIWQSNAAGRYAHRVDTHNAPLDPNFTGCGRFFADSDGRYRFITIKPGAYPWGNHANAWRPPHIHFSLFGEALATRLVTQMYFPGDPLLEHDPIYLSTADERVRQRLVSILDWSTTTPGFALGYRFDIVLRGHDATPMEN